MENNLTFHHNIIKDHTTEALEGHIVVVLEKKGAAGEVFRYQLEPGQVPPKPRLSLTDLFRGGEGPLYRGFAVTDNPELRTSVNVDVKLDDHKHSLAVGVTIGYRVDEPRLVVARRNDDPLTQMQDEVSAAVARALAQREWSEIRHRFRDIEQQLVPVLLVSLQSHAGSYGFSIVSLSLTCRFAEQDQRLIEQEIEAELEAERKKIELKQLIALRPLHAEVKAHERQDMVHDAAAAAAAEAIRNVPKTIHTVAELAKGIETFSKYSDNADEFKRRLLKEASQAGEGGSGTALIIADMLMETEALTCTVAEKRDAQSAILHLMAEVIREEPDPDVVRTYQQRIRKVAGECDVAELGEVAGRFADAESLREQLC